MNSKAGAGPKSKEECTLCNKLGLKSFTKENICNYYIPRNGVLCYGGLAINVMHPSLVTQLLPGKKDVTNILLLGSICGAAFYMYGRPHLKDVTNGKRGLYAIVGGGLWAMGSVLGWAILKSVLPPDNNALAAIAGLITAYGTVKISTDYINEIDKLDRKK